MQTLSPSDGGIDPPPSVGGTKYGFTTTGALEELGLAEVGAASAVAELRRPSPNTRVSAMHIDITFLNIGFLTSRIMFRQ